MAIPPPRPGLVISYSFLWNDEHRKGREEGTKNHPCVIVLSTVRASVHKTVAGLEKAGLVDKATMREFDALCLSPVELLSPTEIRALRGSASRSPNRYSRTT